MKYLQLFSIHNLALLGDWLEENKELFVDIYRPHSGGSSFQYFIRSLEELKELIQKESWDEICFTILRERQFLLRGIADEKMLEKALKEVNDGEYYNIISLKTNFPKAIDFLGVGNKHSEIIQDFTKLFGQEIGFGQNPFDIHEDKWFLENPKDVFRLSITKNQNYYEKVIEDSEKYEELESFWLK